LRLIHPLNSFLLPKRNLINYDGSNLGEETELISFVSEKIKLIFKDQYDEFDTISMKYNFQPSNTNISNIEWVDYSKKYSNKSRFVNDVNTKAFKISKIKSVQNVEGQKETKCFKISQNWYGQGMIITVRFSNGKIYQYNHDEVFDKTILHYGNIDCWERYGYYSSSKNIPARVLPFVTEII